MTTERDPGTRIVLSWLREDAHENAERVLLRALDEVDTTQQRRSWRPAWRFDEMHVSMKLGLAAAAVVVVLLAGYQLLPRTGSFGGTPTAAPTASPLASPPKTSPPQTAAPAATPVPYSLTPADGTLPPGSIVLDGAFPLAIAFDVPAGWSRHGGAEGADYVGLSKLRGDLTPAGVSWTLIGNVYPDACHTTSGPANPPTGPTVDDLVAALTRIIGFDATTPTDVTIDGYAGKRFKITATADPRSDGCSDPVWLSLWKPRNGGDTARVPGGTSLEFWVLDVNGTRLVMFTENYGATASELAEATAIMESVRFD
jgi:hypothetical protein